MRVSDEESDCDFLVSTFCTLHTRFLIQQVGAPALFLTSGKFSLLGIFKNDNNPVRQTLDLLSLGCLL